MSVAVQLSQEKLVRGEVAGACCGTLPLLELSESEVEQLAAIAKAIAHPVRLQIVELLSRFGGQVCACDIEAQFALSQPTISHHLKVLRTAGLIDYERRGLWAFYFARGEGLDALRTFLDGLS